MAEQSFKSHARWLPAFHFFVIPVLLVNFLNSGRHAYLEQTRHSLWELIVAAALLTLGFLARTQALAAQDRVIRLEQRLRLRGLLPSDLHGQINTLTTSQLIALRFAGDDEVAGLVGEILAGRLASQKDIKSRVKNWQADWQRV